MREVVGESMPAGGAILAAALLAAAAVGAAVLAGSEVFKPRPVVVAPSTQPSTTAYTVTIPDGAAPASQPDEVVAAAALLGPVEAMTFLPAGTVLEVDGGLSEPIEGALWRVVVVRADGPATYYLGDRGLAFVFPEPAPTAGPEPTRIPLRSWDPTASLELVSDWGRTVRVETTALPGVGPEMRVEWFVGAGDIGWAAVTNVATEQTSQLLRVDTRTGEASLRALPRVFEFVRLIPTPAGLWVRSEATEVLLIDPISGEAQRTLLTPATGDFLGADADGLWFRIIAGGSPAGAALVDPTNGAVLRRIYTTEQEGSYRGFWNPPSFGSLWDVDRARALVLRIDAVSGQIQAEIDLASVMNESGASSCGDPEPGPRGGAVASFMRVSCMAIDIAIDPATDSIVDVMPAPGLPGSRNLSRAITVGDELWITGILSDDDANLWTGTLVRVDPVTGMGLETLAFNRAHLTSTVPLVLGDHLWFVVGERASLEDPFVQHQVLARIEVSDLVE